jgi:hypothetical protein
MMRRFHFPGFNRIFYLLMIRHLHFPSFKEINYLFPIRRVGTPVFEKIRHLLTNGWFDREGLKEMLPMLKARWGLGDETAIPQQKFESLP